MKNEMEVRCKFLDELQACIEDLVVKAEKSGAFETVPAYALSKANMIDCLIGRARERAMNSIFGNSGGKNR